MYYMILCTNPAAVNFDPTAMQDDGSCLYLKHINGVCYAFQDVDPDLVTDNSFTLSWSLRGNNWVFFHDYLPDFYFSTRDKLYTLKDNRIYKHNAGAPGQYYDNTKKSFFIDAVFPVGGQEVKEATLDTVEWITRVLNGNGTTAREETLTHITIWNSRQCTGRIPLETIFKDLQYKTHRETAGIWSFDDFRDKVRVEGLVFLQDLFHNFDVAESALSDSLAWFDQKLLEDNYFVVRFEFDNLSAKRIELLDTNVQAKPSYR
jgi:hypothetical protein